MAGLQGTGKTTAAGKLALLLKKKGLKVLLVATDVYRPGGCGVDGTAPRPVEGLRVGRVHVFFVDGAASSGKFQAVVSMLCTAPLEARLSCDHTSPLPPHPHPHPTAVCSSRHRPARDPGRHDRRAGV